MNIARYACVIRKLETKSCLPAFSSSEPVIPPGTVITVCSHAEERCPIFLFSTERADLPFEDPAAFVGPAAETLAKFREVCDLISARLQLWLNEQGIISHPLPGLQSAS